MPCIEFYSTAFFIFLVFCARMGIFTAKKRKTLSMTVHTHFPDKIESKIKMRKLSVPLTF